MSKVPQGGARTLFMLTGLFLGIMLMASAYGWMQLPADAQLPIHWNAQGEVDGYGSKFMGLLLLPLITAVLIPGVVWLTRLDPRRDHVEQSQKFLTVVMAAIVVLMTGIHLGIVLASLGHAVPMDRVAGSLIGVLFIVIGNYLGKVRSNYFMGVRTPWTLSSELSWNKTHRLAGKLFMVTGIASTLAALTVGGVVAIVTMVTTLVLTALVSCVYSYVVWRQDPAVH